MFQLDVTHLAVSTSIFLSSQFSKYYVRLNEAASSTCFNILGHFNHKVCILFFHINEKIKDYILKKLEDPARKIRRSKEGKHGIRF